MREIKFRAWTGTQMEYNVMAGFLGAFYVAGINEEDSACMSTFNTIYSKETPVMQYTGLKDKNGKEIYEGDIVKVIETAHSENDTQKRLRSTTADYDINEYVGVVTWDEEGCDYSLVQTGQTIEDAVGFPRHSYEHEVIGSIYENTKLLK